MIESTRQAPLDQYADLLPYPGAPDIDARFERLEPRLRADEPDIFHPAKAALRLLNGSPPNKLHAICWMLIARWHYYHNESEAIQECAEHATKIAETLGDPGLRARALKALALSFQESGRPAEAIPVLVDAFQYAKNAGNDEQTAEVLTNLSISLRNCAQYGEAYECLQRSLSIFPDTVGWENLATLLLMVGDYPAGVKAAREGLLLLGNNPVSRNERGLRISLELNLVLLYIALGDLPQATKHAQLAREYSEGVGELGERLAEIAALVIDAHDPLKADESLNRLIVEAKGVPARSELYRIYRMVTVTALEVAGRPKQALHFLREIAELDMAHHASTQTTKLPPEISANAPVHLDGVVATHLRAYESTLSIQGLRFELAVSDQLERLVTLAIRAELREEEAFSTGEHVYRVARLAELLAQELGCAAEEISSARLTGLLHDLGKVYIPDRVLLKRGQLSSDETSLLKRHSTDGAMLIESLRAEGLARVADAVRHSHECWDGHGYPSALRGEAIPLLARIVTICDSFDVMTHWRLYRRPRSIKSALQEIGQRSGSQYDPVASRLFVDLLRRLVSENKDLDCFLADGSDSSAVVQQQRRLARVLGPKGLTR